LKDKYLSPTIVRNVDLRSPLMSEEIFGPILPIITYRTTQEAIDFCNQRAKPLALYVFSHDEETQRMIIEKTRSGAAVANDMLVHFTNSKLPFGGVGESGLGSYHGKLTFDLFTHQKAVILSSSNHWTDIPARYPPYSSYKQWLVETLTSANMEWRTRAFGKLTALLASLKVAQIIFVKFSGL